MSSLRTYDEAEVARIFEAAAAPVPAHRPGGTGMTLGEIQAIGREVGIAPDRIATAALALDRPAKVQRRKMLGMPVGVGRTVELPRALTDREWAVLLARLRQTFGAQGRDLSSGEVRHWANSRLHALVEPTLDGWQLRLGTMKSDAATVNILGAAGIILGIATMGSAIAAGEPMITGLLPLAGLGGGALAFNAIRLPIWARTREAQMDAIAEDVRLILARSDAE
jgi:hypothetical protein